MKTLVIGGKSGIGAETARQSGMVYSGQIFIPGMEELDVRSKAQFQKYFRQHGPFKKIVFSAGINELMPLGQVFEKSMWDIFDVNVQGFIRLCDAVVRDQTERYGEGRENCSIVAVVSDSATTAMRHSIAYASSKAALAHAVRCAARELAPWCRVNGVSPSIVDDTPMTRAVDRQVQSQRGWTAGEARAYEKSLVPMQRRATKEEVASLVLDVLAGPEFLTGAVIPITGGK